uniref:Uncharacterized protein n=1 Tax=Heterorhabditis bacteriophora TaxID=37862 RepID=A0A1I7WJV6_HETBA
MLLTKLLMTLVYFIKQCQGSLGKSLQYMWYL